MSDATHDVLKEEKEKLMQRFEKLWLTHDDGSDEKRKSTFDKYRSDLEYLWFGPFDINAKTKQKKEREIHVTTFDNAEYVRYEPSCMLSVLYKRYTDYESDDRVTARLEGGPEFKDNMTFTQDITFLITILLTKGSDVNKIKNQLTKKFSDILTHLVQKYKIYTSDDRARRNLYTVTLPRVAACFPQITVNLFHQGFGRAMMEIPSYFGELPVPKVVLSMCFASVMPTKKGETLHHLIIWINYLNDLVIHQTQPEMLTPMSLLISYHFAAFQSEGIRENLRDKVFEKMGLLENGDFIKVLKDAELYAKDKLISTAVEKNWGALFPVKIPQK
ncbi:uncharacterized protein LOC122855125 [Aphidius gifuensis]|uniref:uncharacterized protein LOC122855125 n=1 Tax=Aphidius gifuensis TaxID=684658 RepID=UPI001CDC2F1A|nr:uncharacterized protein LOC122855125 [Aphidius gifuensis]